MPCHRTFSSALSGALLLCAAHLAQASGSSIDKVYHPYVMPIEIEIEWRATFQNDDEQALDDQQLHQLSIGYSPVEHWFTEFYLIGERAPNNGFTLEAVELEAKWQLTEQGEFDYDWGLLFELEREINARAWEFSTALLLERQWGKWVGAANLFIAYEWGDDIDNEVETAFTMQLRYRYHRAFEPALEFFQSEDSTALGPVALGQIRFGTARKIHWELGVIFGLKDATPNQTVKALLEYEF